MNFSKQAAIFAVICIAVQIRGAKILGIFPSFGYSQFVLGGKLMRELAARGHEVTVISPFPSKVPIKNYRDISTEALIRPLGDADLFVIENNSVLGQIIFVVKLGLLLTEYTFETPAVKNLLSSNETFDLVLCELFFNEAHLGFAHHYKAPLVLFNSLGLYEAVHHLVGNPAPYSYVPTWFTDFGDRMTLVQRMKNAFVIIFYNLLQHLYTFRKQNEFLHRYFPAAPELHDLMYKVDLVLSNSHFSTHFPAPRVPSVVEIAGFHVDPKPLPKDLQEFLDNSKEGVVYVSMGSILNGTNLPAEKRVAMLKALAKLKQKVLWKWESDQMPGKPANVKTAKWLPQQDVLAHPNVQVFVSHCGLLSTTESMYHGVPIIGVPIFGDQKMNMAITEGFGAGITLRLPEITEATMTSALNEILTNPKYRERAQLRSKLMRDQPVRPIDKAMFWIEYVLRHKGAQHLRVAGLELSWYQYYMLDVIAIVLFALFGGSTLVYWAFKKILSKNVPAGLRKEKAN